jgi:hypothetical protein
LPDQEILGRCLLFYWFVGNSFPVWQAKRLDGACCFVDSSVATFPSTGTRDIWRIPAASLGLGANDPVDRYCRLQTALRSTARARRHWGNAYYFIVFLFELGISPLKHSDDACCFIEFFLGMGVSPLPGQKVFGCLMLYPSFGAYGNVLRPVRRYSAMFLDRQITKHFMNGDAAPYGT